MRACFLALISSFLLPPFSICQAAAPRPMDDDEKFLRANGVPADGPGLLEFVRKRFASPLSEDRLRKLVEQLGDDTFTKREEASRQLVMAGRAARPMLVEALKHDDPEVRHRAGRCLKQVSGEGTSTRVLAAALRVLGRLKPEGAAAAMVQQIPAMLEERYAPAAREAFAALAVRDGKADPAYVAALTDASATRRHAAAMAILASGGADQVPALLKRLGDDNRDVRFDVALGLARLKRKEAIPALIAEFERPYSTRFGQAEEILCRLAGDKAPTLDDGDDDSRRAYRKAWEKWWGEKEATADLSPLDDLGKPLGRTVVVLLDENLILGLDPENKVRWTMTGVQMVLDIQPLPGDRVLLAEHNGNRITERTGKGKLLWEMRAEEPLVAQRMADGHTLLSTKSSVIEVDRDGREVWRYEPPNNGTSVMRARKLPSGDVLLVLGIGGATQFVRLDVYGQEVRRFNVDVGTFGGRLDVTAAGNVLVPEMHANRVAEYDDAGKAVRTIAVDEPIACVVLPNGNIIVTSQKQKRAVELDRANKEVWQYRYHRDTRVTRAIRY